MSCVLPGIRKDDNSPQLRQQAYRRHVTQPQTHRRSQAEVQGHRAPRGRSRPSQSLNDCCLLESSRRDEMPHRHELHHRRLHADSVRGLCCQAPKGTSPTLISILSPSHRADEAVIDDEGRLKCSWASDWMHAGDRVAGRITEGKGRTLNQVDRTEEDIVI